VSNVHRRAVEIAGLVVVAATAGAGAPVRVVYDGHKINTSAPVAQFSRGTLVPLRPVVAALGGQLVWDEGANTAAVRYRGRSLEVDEAKHIVRLDGQRVRRLIVPCTVRGQLLVPLADIESLFGVRGHWMPQQHLLTFVAQPGGSGAAARSPFGLAAGSGASGRRGTNNPAPSSGLLLGLTADRKTYAVGTPVRLTMSISNPARPTMTLQFSSGLHYDFEVRRGRETVWRWSAGRMFTQALTNLTVGPGERRVFSETWNQRDNNGQPVSPGTYTAIATLTTMTRPQPQTPPVTFNIGR
jgi:intracellular proteinase inhibitor BsuPI/copper amine oxidase-like protein